MCSDYGHCLHLGSVFIWGFTVSVAGASHAYSCPPFGALLPPHRSVTAPSAQHTSTFSRCLGALRLQSTPSAMHAHSEAWTRLPGLTCAYPTQQQHLQIQQSTAHFRSSAQASSVALLDALHHQIHHRTRRSTSLVAPHPRAGTTDRPRPSGFISRGTSVLSCVLIPTMPQPAPCYHPFLRVSSCSRLPRLSDPMRCSYGPFRMIVLASCACRSLST